MRLNIYKVQIKITEIYDSIIIIFKNAELHLFPNNHQLNLVYIGWSFEGDFIPSYLMQTHTTGTYLAECIAAWQLLLKI